MFLHRYAHGRARPSKFIATGGSLLANIIGSIGNIVRRIPPQDLLHGAIGTIGAAAGAYGIKKAVDAAKAKKEQEAAAAKAAANVSVVPK